MSNLFKKNEFYLVVVIAVLVLFLGITTDQFLDPGNLLELFTSYSFLGTMSAGMLIVLISGGIDLSFTATATISQYVMSTIIIGYGGNVFIAYLIGAGVGVSLGLINGFLIHFIKKHPLIITIATLNVFNGLLMYFTKGKWIYNFPMWFSDPHDIVVFESAEGNIYPITLPLFLFFIIFVITALVLQYTKIGRKIYALGGNKEAARRMGFNIFGLTLFVYGFMGFIAGIGSVSHALIVQTVAPNAIVGKELDVIAAVVLGGASLDGGSGSVFGTFLGVALVAIISNAVILLGIPSYWYQILLGTIIVISVSMTAMNHKRNMKKEAEIDVA
ncbi:MAG: ABC transporter permease [Spartobacteria bacterium]|nr:ABC transporter permease [Spartobacteria bacterium]